MTKKKQNLRKMHAHIFGHVFLHLNHFLLVHIVIMFVFPLHLVLSSSSFVCWFSSLTLLPPRYPLFMRFFNILLLLLLLLLSTFFSLLVVFSSPFYPPSIHPLQPLPCPLYIHVRFFILLLFLLSTLFDLLVVFSL